MSLQCGIFASVTVPLAVIQDCRQCGWYRVEKTSEWCAHPTKPVEWAHGGAPPPDDCPFRMEDRSSMDLAVATETVVLTPAAQSVKEGRDYTVAWLERKLQELKLPAGEFLIEVGVKGRRSGMGVAVKPDSLALFGEDASTAITRVRVEVTDYLVRFTWRHAGGELTIPLSFPKNLIDSSGREAAFVSKIRWVMTELMLGRFSLQGYR